MQISNSRLNVCGLRRTAVAVAVAALGLGAADTMAAPLSPLGVGVITLNVVGNGAGATDTQAATHATTTANAVAVAGTSAVTTITLATAPAADSTLTIGNCVVTFKAGTTALGVQDNVDCTTNAGTIDLSIGGDGTNAGAARTQNELATILRTLTSVDGGTHGALTASGSGADAVFTSANKVTGNPTVTPPTGITSSNTTPGVATVIAATQIDTITIGGSIDIGDAFTVTLPDSTTATFIATTTSPSDAAAGLNTAIQAASYYTNGGGSPTRLFDSSVSTDTITLTAKVAGTGFTVTSNATNYPGVSAVAQVDSWTPDCSAGETCVITIGSRNYFFVPTLTNADVIHSIKSQIDADTNAVVTTSTKNFFGTDTDLLLTAKVPGTPFDATHMVIGVADATKSTLILSNSTLAVGGSTATATLTLKDVNSVALMDVSASGATLASSDTSKFTVGSTTLSSTNGTITATVTPVAAGSGTITGTIDGSTAVTSAPVTVGAAASFATAPALGTTTAAVAPKSGYVSLYSFKLTAGAGETITSAKVNILGGTATASDFSRIALYAITASGAYSQVGSDLTSGITVDGSTLTVPVGGVAIDPNVTYQVLAYTSNAVDGHTFTAAIPQDAITLSANSPTNSLSVASGTYTVDATPAVTTAANPAISSVTGTGATYTATLNEAGNGWYVVLPATDPAPSAQQVYLGKDASNASAAIHGGAAMVANTAKAFSISGLSAATDYKLYFVTTDSGWNLSTLDTQAFTTASVSTPAFGTTPTIAISPTFTIGIGGGLELFTFTLTGITDQTLSSVKVKIADAGGNLVASDIASIELMPRHGNTGTLAGSPQTSVNVDGSVTTIDAGNATIDTTATYGVVLWTKTGMPTDGAHFTVTIPADAITLSSGAITSSTVTGTSVVTIDSTRPTLSDIGVSGTTSSGAVFSVTSSEAGHVYYVVLPASATAPTVAQVRAGKDANNTTASIKANAAMLLAATNYRFTVSGLSASTAYKMYYVVTDAAGNVPTAMATGTASVESFTTLASSVSTPTADPTPATTIPSTTPPAIVTPPTGITVPTGTTLTPVGSVSTVFSGTTGSGVTVSGGTIAINTSALTSGSAPLELLSSVPVGTGIVLSAPTAGTAPAAVSFKVGGQTLTVTPSSSGNTLLTTASVQINGQAQQVLVVSSGSASFTASAAGQVVGAVTIPGSSTPVVLTATDSTSSASVSSNADGATITSSKGSITISITGFANGFAADGAATSLKLYAGEKLNLNATGQVTAITLSSASGKGGAGDALSAPATLGFSGCVPVLNAPVERLSGKSLQQAVADALGATLGGNQSASGVLNLSTAGGTVSVLPVGTVTINPSKADGLVLGSDGLAAVSKDGVTVKFAPSVADPVQLAADLAKALPGASASINASGTVIAKVGDATYAVRPDWTTGQASGSAGFSTGADGVLRYLDAQGNQTALHPAFLDLAAARNTVESAVPGSTSTANADGSITLKAGDISYTLTPDFGQAPTSNTVTLNVMNGKTWWIENGKLFLNGNGGVQGVTVR